MAQSDVKAIPRAGKAETQGGLRLAVQLGGQVREKPRLDWEYKEPRGSLTAFRKAAEQRNVDAQLSPGGMYDEYNGVAQGFVKAAKWFRKAACHWNAIAENNLAVMYENRYEMVKSVIEAARWYRKAAEQENADA